MTKKGLAKAFCLTLAAGFVLTGCGSKDKKEDAKETKQEALATDETTPELDGYKLLWSDEFNGTKLDESIWTREKRDPGWTNEELQEYTDSEENSFIRDGKLVLKAIKTEKDGKPYYTSGKVQTQNKKDFMYGKVSVRAKVPEGQGLWPAAWMMPTVQEKYGEWPRCGEIDVMEVLCSDTKTAYATIHYGVPHAEQQKVYTLTTGSFASDFHEFSVEWEPGEMRYYIDGNLYQTINDWFTAPTEGGEEVAYPAPFNQDFFVQLNLAVGGTWPGNPDDTTDFDKAEYEIDYVRVYQKEKYDTNVKKPEKKFREATADGNLIYNGSFTDAESLDDEEQWSFLLFEGGAGSAEIKDGELVIKTDNEGTVDYSVQIVQPNLPMIKGKKYKVSFDCYADEERDLIVAVTAPTANWVRYLNDTMLHATTEKQTFTYEFEMTAKDDNNGRLEFNMGHKGSTATIHISNVRVEEVQ